MNILIKSRYQIRFVVGVALIWLFLFSIAYAEVCDSPPVLTAERWNQLRNGQVLLEKLDTHSEAFGFIAYILIPAAPENVMSYLRDLEEVRRNIPNLKRIKYICEEDICRLSVTLDMKVRTVTNTVEQHFINDCHVTTKLIKGELADVAGYYKLYSVDGNASTLVERKFYMYPDVGIPVWMMSRGTEANLPDALIKMRHRVIERSS